MQFLEALKFTSQQDGSLLLREEALVLKCRTTLHTSTKCDPSLPISAPPTV